ncbi:MAG: trypsin-like peptidase domain-containing protein [Armatimonadota bacterium]|nr:trypsin-like peptidase domain-containing protein [Armatimonadota bacterium]MDR7455986.1 trypsin-like peptidase domain-containing protein [Armatimonadota bacterium]
MMRRAMVLARAAVLAALLVGAGSPALHAQISSALIEYGLARSVMLGILVRDTQGGLREISHCSASLVSPRGMLLTASHCVRADQEVARYGIGKGQLYNAEGLATVYLNLPNQVRPILMLFARLVADIRVPLDLALLRTDRLTGSAGERALPPDFSVPHLALGDGETVRHGDPIVLIGFPSVGGDTVTVARGHVTGFTADAGGRRIELKTDVGAPGFSGAPVINERGEQIAVHTSSRVEADRAARSGRATLLSRLPAEWSAHLGVQAQATPQQSAGGPVPPGGTSPVFLQGRVADASLGIPVAGASLWVLAPGTAFGDATNESVVASALTDAAGAFVTRPAVARGFTYPIVVMAVGYRRLNGFVSVPAASPGGVGTNQVFAAGTIALARQ